MPINQDLIASIFQGWYAYQQVNIYALAPLNEEQLELRAGGWNVYWQKIRAAYRLYSGPTGNDSVIGFRCATSVKGE